MRQLSGCGIASASWQTTATRAAGALRKASRPGRFTQASRPTHARVPSSRPSFKVSTFHQDAVGSPRDGWEYSRSGNPTRAALEACLADLDGGARGLAFASGLAAEDCILRTLCAPHDHVVVPGDAYGGTFRLVDKVFGKWDVVHTSVDLSDLDWLVSRHDAEDESGVVRDSEQSAARHR